MKLMLTSFGVEQCLTSAFDAGSPFYRMPPVSFRAINESFMPDYELLLLCDKIVMDESSFQRLVEHPSRVYTKVAETFKALNGEGRIELADFSYILRENGPLLNRMIDHDIKVLDQWVVPLRESLGIWREFMDKSAALMRTEPDEWIGPHAGDVSLHETMHAQRAFMRHTMHRVANEMHSAKAEAMMLSVMVEDALQSSEKRKLREYRQALRGVLRAYLTYVNSNLILSNTLQVGFHDWLDFTPFYGLKFMSIGKDEVYAEESRKQVEKLFTVAFPELAIEGTAALVRALGDKRIEELRRLIDDAAHGKVQFDEAFAKAVLAEVFRGERKASKFRSVFGYLTLPMDFIPWVGGLAQKALEETVGSVVEKKIKQKHQWFYMLSEIADSRDKK